MPKLPRHFKSRTFRRVKRAMPSGEVRTLYKRRKAGKHQCGGCGMNLPGIPHMLTYKFRNLPKSQKRPTRPFGGVYCSRCLRQEMVKRAHAMEAAQ
jgi:large subunit ribosomal protein L34e